MSDDEFVEDRFRMSEELLSEQLDYYRRRADEYDETAYGSRPMVEQRIARIVSTLPEGVSTLELACGTGMWTRALARRTNHVTAVDAAPEALEVARRRSPASVRFVCANVMRGLPPGRFDLIFFAFWLSHVPLSLWPDFFGRVRQSLAPSGHVVFVDEHVSQAAKEKGTGEPEVVERVLEDGSLHRVVKVFLDPDRTAEHLARFGWNCHVTLDQGDWVIGTASWRDSCRDPDG